MHNVTFWVLMAGTKFWVSGLWCHVIQ